MPSLQALLYAILALTSTTFAAVNGRCSIDGTPGVCIPSAKCTESGGTNRVGFCPDDTTDIRCCTKPSCGEGGNCQWTAECTGTTKSGLCPGQADFKCCLTSGGGSLGGGSDEATSHDISANGVRFIAEFEGFNKNFYTDEAGVKTIGYGHACQPTSACNDIDAPITKTEGETLIRSDAHDFVKCVNENVKVKLNNNQFDALVSFGFNLGCSCVKEIAEPLNNNDFKGATEKMKEYVHVGSRVSAGLVRRRNEEVALFNS